MYSYMVFISVVTYRKVALFHISVNIGSIGEGIASGLVAPSVVGKPQSELYIINLLFRRAPPAQFLLDLI